MSEHLLLKWGTLKGWEIESDAAKEAFDRWMGEGASVSAMMQRNTDTQIDALCELIDAIDGEIHNDWSGEEMSKAEAKKYVREYRK